MSYIWVKFELIILSVERIPSNEAMPPPPATPSHYSHNTSRDPSTGYSSSMSDQQNPCVSPKARLSIHLKLNLLNISSNFYIEIIL